MTESQTISKLELDILIHEYEKKKYSEEYDARLKTLLEEREKTWNPISLDEFGKRMDKRKEEWRKKYSK